MPKSCEAHETFLKKSKYCPYPQKLQFGVEGAKQTILSWCPKCQNENSLEMPKEQRDEGWQALQLSLHNINGTRGDVCIAM